MQKLDGLTRTQEFTPVEQAFLELGIPQGHPYSPPVVSLCAAEGDDALVDGDTGRALMEGVFSLTHCQAFKVQAPADSSPKLPDSVFNRMRLVFNHFVAAFNRASALVFARGLRGRMMDL